MDKGLKELKSIRNGITDITLILTTIQLGIIADRVEEDDEEGRLAVKFISALIGIAAIIRMALLCRDIYDELTEQEEAEE